MTCALTTIDSTVAYQTLDRNDNVSTAAVLDRQHYIEQLYREHAGTVKRHLHSMLNQREDVADVLQDVFLRIINMSDPQKLNENPVGYLIRVATNLVLDRYRRETSRKSGAHDSLEYHELAAEDPAPELQVYSLRMVDRINAAVSKAGPRVAKVVAKYHHEGMTHHEIAAEMGVTVRTIERDMRKAREYCVEFRVS